MEQAASIAPGFPLTRHAYSLKGHWGGSITLIAARTASISVAP